MIAPRCQRPNSQLRQLLDDQLPAAAAADVTQHLEQCEACQQQLETLAAGVQWWSEAKQFLSSDDTGKVPAAPLDECVSDESVVEPSELVRGFLDPPREPNMLGRLDEYDVVKVIGCGGMGIVFQAYDSQLERPIAIKVLAPHYATSALARKRFAREAQAAAAVVHPHVLAIHGVNGNSRLPYLVMPLVAGPSLQQRVDEAGALELKDVLRIGMQAAQGLAAAHAQGLVHRDVKPANILLENGVQRVLLTDFGLARAIDDVSLTHSGVIAGTPQYMSPEQARGEPVDHRTDLFSLGSVLFTLCAGRPPFRAESTLGVMRRICDVAARDLREVDPEIPEWLADVIARLLAKDREDRFQSADEVAQLLSQYLAHLQHPAAVSLPPLAAWRQPAKTSARRPPNSTRPAVLVAAGMVLSVACVLGAMAIGGWFGNDRTDTELGSETGPVTEQVTGDGNGQRAVPSASDLQWDDGMESTLMEIGQDLDQLELDGSL